MERDALPDREERPATTYTWWIGAGSSVAGCEGSAPQGLRILRDSECPSDTRARILDRSDSAFDER